MLRKLSDREHVLQRPAMYIGAVDLTKTKEYMISDKAMEYSDIEYVPGLIKIINEIIDNSVDIAIKTDFKECNEISIKISSDSVEVKDNGTGIPVKQNEDGHEFAELAWGHARAGSNFDDDDNRTQIGMNGVGSFATNCFSKKFIGKTDDGSNSYTITFTDNASSFSDKKSKSVKSGVQVNFWPDLERFGLTEIDDTHMNIIRQRLINLSMSFPDITFKFNNKKINVNSFKKYVELFSKDHIIHETEDYKFAFVPNTDEEFRHFSYVNGLKIPDGGTHIDLIANGVAFRLRDKLIKKFKTIKPADIKNKLLLIVFMKNVKNTKFNSQAKEKITNSFKEINDFFGNIPYDDITLKMFRNKAIIDPITEIYRIREEFKRRQELKGLKGTSKKIKSEKYLPSIGVKKYLILCEGESAVGGLSPILGRNECGYYELTGVPLNAFSADQSKFTKNKSLSELYKIIENENYQYVIFGNDADLDGIHIAGLLVGFFERYLPHLKGRIGRLLTPVKFTKKNNKPKKWVYTFSEELSASSGEEFSYMKGLGSWNIPDLKHIVDVDGLKKMIDIFEFDDDKIISDWLGDDSAPRKEYIENNDFSIAKL